MAHDQQVFRYSRWSLKYLTFCLTTIMVGCLVWIFWMFYALTKTPKPIPPEGVFLSTIIIGISILACILFAWQLVDVLRHRIVITSNHVQIIGIRNVIRPLNSIRGYRIRGLGAETDAFLFLISKQSKKQDLYIGLRSHENPKDIINWAKKNFADLDALDLESGIPLGPGWRE